MPTAVMTESSENTASRTTTCAITFQNLPCPAPWLSSWGWPSSRSCSSEVALNSRKKPPSSRMIDRPDSATGPSVSSGLVSVMSHDIIDSSTMRITRASPRPIMRARSRSAGGSLLTRMAMKTRLSMPRTISSTTSVTSPIQMDGSASQDIERSGSHDKTNPPMITAAHARPARRGIALAAAGPAGRVNAWPPGGSGGSRRSGS